MTYTEYYAVNVEVVRFPFRVFVVFRWSRDRIPIFSFAKGTLNSAILVRVDIKKLNFSCEVRVPWNFRLFRHLKNDYAVTAIPAVYYHKVIDSWKFLP